MNWLQKEEQPSNALKSLKLETDKQLIDKIPLTIKTDELLLRVA